MFLSVANVKEFCRNSYYLGKTATARASIDRCDQSDYKYCCGISKQCLIFILLATLWKANWLLTALAIEL